METGIRRQVEFKVPGLPKPAGSKRAITIPGRKFSQIIDDSKNKPWIKTVQQYAVLNWGKDVPSSREFQMQLTFILPRPKAHYRADGSLKTGAPGRHAKKPDATKLTRCVEDALTGIVWVDDAQVVHQSIAKTYSDDRWTGVFIRVRELEPCLIHNPKTK